MKHSVTGCKPYTATIEIEEYDDKKCIITVFDSTAEVSSTLDLSQLHSFIGTLLHVQAQIKKR